MAFSINPGIWPVMITPWTEDNKPDYKAIKGLVKSDGTEPERPGEKPGENKPGEKPGVNKPGADGKLSNTGADVFGLIAAMTMLAAAGVTMAGLRKRIG